MNIDILSKIVEFKTQYPQFLNLAFQEMEANKIVLNKEDEIIEINSKIFMPFHKPFSKIINPNEIEQ